MRKHVLLYRLLGGVLIAALKLIEYRWLVVEYSVEIYGGLVAAVFATLGIWLGLRFKHPSRHLLWRFGALGQTRSGSMRSFSQSEGIDEREDTMSSLGTAARRRGYFV